MTDQTANRADRSADKTDQRRKRRSHKSPKVKIGRNNKPPQPVTSSTANSWTSPRRLARRRRIDEALGYREQGYGFLEIAREMKVSISTAHAYVVEGLDLIPLENAKRVLAMELKRLDAVMAAHYGNAVAGDLAATSAVLRVMDQRAKLLGLYPKEGSALIALNGGAVNGADGGAPLPVQITFVVPTGRREAQEDAPPAPEHGPYPWQKALPAPAPLQKDAFGVWRPLGRTE
jgi:hypothetical protein